ncbi:MAG: RNA polymerase sigma factor [Aestuariivirga sp.]|nr:RNA polymerase sigma factor [Aestuariivirga sp.]
MTDQAEQQPFRDLLVGSLPKLRRFALSLTGSRQRADDLVQTACMKALAAQGDWRQETRVEAWIFRILRNAWIDEIRHGAVRGPHADLADHEDAATTDGEAAVMSKLTLASVLAALDSLPPEQREVMVLVCVEEFSYAEVASMTGVPIGTVMSRLARARQKFAGLAGI